MSLRTLLLPLLLTSSLGLPTPSPAAEAGAPPTPHRRGADPAVVRSLQANLWTLQSGSEASGQPIDGLTVPGQAFTLRFQDARVSVQGGCNTMNGSWRLSPQNQLTIGRLAATMKACDAPLMKADATLSAILAQPLDAQVQPGDKPTLRLLSTTRQTLLFSGQPTPQALYGKATRIFLEVAPQKVACTSGTMPAQCLRVREIRFDAQGLRIEPPGEWYDFHGRIEGYTHHSGVRNVLRIDRYTRPQPVPADASAFVYMLDLVVESELVSK
jgi:heat shock protein HslJ